MRLPLPLWYKASLLDDVKATEADDYYELRPADRGMLPFKSKRVQGGLICKLYNLRAILKVARATHLQRPIASLKTLQGICSALGIETDGSHAILRARIATQMACTTSK